MDDQFFCRECGAEHLEPADARLGHVVTCLQCAMHSELYSLEIEVAAVATPIAA